MERFSVCMSVYYGDKASCFRQSVNSLLSQTRIPDEIVLVVDGPVGEEINKAISFFENAYTFLKVKRLKNNSGHAIARQAGLEAASYGYIAIMDSDDIAVPYRFEKQMNFIENHPDVDALGGQIDEFVGNPSNVVGSRSVPLTDEEIKNYMKSRCPMNLVTVMLKKDSVKKAGGYIDWYCEEDYYLWVRMLEQGMRFANLPDTLVSVRVGKDMYNRRGGLKYFKSEAKLQKYLWHKGIISSSRFVFNVLVRLCVQVLMPNWMRGFVFQKLFRK